jgi:hypothetical protein
MANADNRKRASASPQTATPYASADERRGKGRALRDAVPRMSHAGWKPSKGRRGTRRRGLPDANWLSAPNDNIYLVMRLYWPKDTPPSILPAPGIPLAWVVASK